MNNTIDGIFDVLTERASTNPQANAVIESETLLSNQQLLDQVNGVAQYLIEAGVNPGDRVATLSAPSINFWITFMATTSIGAIWVGLNPLYQSQELSYLLDDLKPTLVFAPKSLHGRNYVQELTAIATTETRMVSLQETPLSLAANPDNEPLLSEELTKRRADINPEDVAVIVYTSGTTGKPKGAMLSHRAIVATATSYAQALPKEYFENTICALPINHVGGLNNVCFTTFVAGGSITFNPAFNLDLMFDPDKSQATFMVGGTTLWAMMIASGMDFSKLDFYKLIVFGGSAATLPHLQELKKTGARLSCIYGQTETTGMITLSEQADSLETMSATIGKAIAGNKIRIASSQGTLLQTGEIGEIQVKGVSVMSGYWNKPDATRETFTEDQWLKTGDLGYLREDGHIAFTGRLKEMFKSGGYNVYPVEVEQAICDHPDILDAVVVERPDDTYQEVGHAFLLAKPEADISYQQLKSFLSSRLANYKIPKSTSLLENFPLLPNGKTDRKSIRKLLPSD